MGAGDSVETTRVFNIRGTAGRSLLCAQWQENSATKITTTKANSNGVGEELFLWRERFTFSDAMAELKADHRDKQFSVAVLFSGGLLDTFAAVRSGFTPIWGCENNVNQARMWEAFTGCKNLGDVFGPTVLKAEKPMYLKSGAPCPNYARSGNQLGADGVTGWMFVQQADVINTVQPWVFCLEISDNALFVNNGAEVKAVRTKLGHHYVIKSKVIRMWQHGDPSNRRRLFMVGFHRELGQAAYDFQFPRGGFDDHKWPSARDIAEPDSKVPASYWRTDLVPSIDKVADDFKPATLHKVGSKGSDMGRSSLPNAVYSWDGLLNSQTTLNGGGRRPALDWKHGEAIDKTRLCLPVETIRAASLPSDYSDFAAAFAEGGSTDVFLRLCVNNGVPVRTGVAIDSAIKAVLMRALNQLKMPTKKWASLAHNSEQIRSILFDTGANGSLSHRDVEEYLLDAVKSSSKITVADGNCMSGSTDGLLKCMVVNSARQKGFQNMTPFQFNTTTSDGLAMELLSFDEFYRDGWGAHLRPLDVEDGICELYRPKRGDIPAASVPFRYDWSGGGGFYLDYIITKDAKPEHKAWLAACYTDQLMANSAVSQSEVKYFDGDQVRAMANDISDGRSKDVLEVMIGQHPMDCEIRGVKAGLRTEKQRMTELEFHQLFGHIGFCPQCKICKLSKGASRRIRRKVDPHRETRPGHTWCLDTVTFSHRSEQGNKYMTVARCEATGKFRLFFHYLKSDIRDLVEDWIDATRADSAFHKCNYQVISRIKLDNAGEWDRECKDWKSLMQSKGVDCVYSCPDRKESAAHAEHSCGIVEVVIKSMLFQSNLPPSWWQHAAGMAEWILDRFPVSSQSVSVPMDGDRARPLELYTQDSYGTAGYSRRQIDRELSYFVGLGTPCLVQTKAKGSALKPKTRWGICIGMYRESCIFWCPYTKVTFRSKSFAAFRLREGLNFATFLGLPELASSRASTAIPQDFKQQVTVHLTEVQTCAPQVAEAIAEVKTAGDLAHNVPVVSVVDCHADLGGSVRVIDSSGLQIDMDPESDKCFAKACSEEGDQVTVCKNTKTEVKDKQARVKRSTGIISAVGISTSALQYQFDRCDAEKCKSKAIYSEVGDTFTRVCKLHKLPFEQHNLYKQWLIQLRHVRSADIPVERRGAKLNAGVLFVFPSGSVWRKLIAEGSRKRRRAEFTDVDEEFDAVEAAEIWMRRELQTQKQSFKLDHKYCFNVKQATEQLEAIKYNSLRACAAKRGKKKCTKAVGTGKESAPASTYEALNCEKAHEWVKSLGNEFWGLVDMGVLDLGYTMQQLKDIGITSTPIPLGEYYECKFDEDGDVNKRKSRMAVQGHPGNMKKGIHYSETFSATPRESSARILCALVALMNLKRVSFDITKAYCWADLPPGELIALKYPSAFQEYEPVTNEKLYIVLRKNLYGHPSAGRTFGKARDAAILEKFNVDGWTASRCRMDPCMFVITRKADDGSVQRAWMLAHVDDCDIAADSDELAQQVLGVCKSIWKCETVSSDFMLGVRRRVFNDTEGKVKEVVVDMIPFVEGMAEAFQTHLPNVEVKEPIPSKFTVSKVDVVDDAESTAVLDAGFQSAMGMALWAARHCFPECRVGCSLICRVMAKPSWKAFYALMHMIKWMRQHKARGVKYSAGVNTVPLWLVDASNKPDPADGKCQYGVACMFMGGPILEHSKKLKHVGLSSQHNEYMAMAFANQSIVWMRQLFEEMGLMDLIAKPFVLLADNKPANILSKEDIISSGNQYIFLPYHFNKEVQEMGFSAVSYVKSVDNISDLMTKAVDAHTVKQLVPALTGHDLRLITKLIAGLEAAPKMTANVMKLDLETLRANIAKHRRG